MEEPEAAYSMRVAFLGTYIEMFEANHFADLIPVGLDSRGPDFSQFLL